MSDIAEVALDTIHRQLRIDDEWTVWRDRGFSWSALRLRQDFDVSSPFMDDGVEICRVYSTTVVVEDVKSDHSHVIRILDTLNRQSVGAAFVWDRAGCRLICHLGASVHSETVGWRPAQVADYAILALRTCEEYADRLAELLHGRVPVWQHPASGYRAEPDEMLFVTERAFAPEGNKPSRFADVQEMAVVYKDVENTPYFSAGANEAGVCIEVPFGGDTILVELKTRERHPTLGAGLLAVIKIRVPLIADRSPLDIASELNWREANGEFTRANFGAWCAAEVGGYAILAHSRFVPNLLFRPMLARDVAFSMVNRARWAASLLLPEHVETRWASEILMERWTRPEH